MLILMQDLQVVIPTLNDDAVLAQLLAQLALFELRCVVVDGADSAETRALVESYGGGYLQADPGRGGQVRAGIEHCDSTWVWILHADAKVSRLAVSELARITALDELCWGRFNVHLPGLGIIAFFMNWRSRLTRICTGDQGIFIHRRLIQDIGGFPAIPLMEDIEVCRRLKSLQYAQFHALDVQLGSSTRRWQKAGVVRTILFLWRCRWQYFRGTSADTLYERYYR